MQELKLSQTLDGANMSPYHTTGEFATSLVLLWSRAESRTSVSLSIRFLLSHSHCQICACLTNICLKCVLPMSIVNREIKCGISRSLCKNPPIPLVYLMSTSQKHTYEITVVLDLKKTAFDYDLFNSLDFIFTFESKQCTFNSSSSRLKFILI